MAAAAAVITVGLTGDMRLRLGERLDGHPGFAYQIVKPPTGNRIPAAVDHDCGFKKARCRNPTLRGLLDRVCIDRGVSFARRIATSAELSTITRQARLLVVE